MAKNFPSDPTEKELTNLKADLMSRPLDHNRGIVVGLVNTILKERKERDKYKEALERIDAMKPEDFMEGQEYLTPAFREPDLKQAMRFVIKTVNKVLHNADEHMNPL